MLLTSATLFDRAPFLEELTRQKAIVQEGTDAALRPLFVTAQADIERRLSEMLLSGEATSVLGVIHTPAPATPLCTNGAISPQLAAFNDPERLATLKERPDILRSLLSSGATLISAYPAGGRQLRTAEQLAIFDALLAEHPHLHARELSVASLPPSMSGATYWICLASGHKLVFSIMSYQAHTPTDGTWGIWLGDAYEPEIAERSAQVLDFLEKNGLRLGE